MSDKQVLFGVYHYLLEYLDNDIEKYKDLEGFTHCIYVFYTNLEYKF